MSRTKSILDEYFNHKNSSTQNQNTKYVPTDYQTRKMYSYDLSAAGSSKRAGYQSKAEPRRARTYYIPVSTKHGLSTETFYKHEGVSDLYKNQRPYPTYYFHNPVQNAIPTEHNSSVMYLKYPKSTREEKLARYYEQIDSRDYYREPDFYEYDDIQNIHYYEPGRKSDYNHAHLYNDNEELYYDEYVPEPSFEKHFSKADKSSDYYSQYTPEIISQTKTKSNYLYEEYNDKNIKNVFKEIPQKITSKAKYSQDELEPVKPNSSTDKKIDCKISDNSELSTLYDRNSNLNSNFIPIYKTCTVSSQTSDTNIQIDDKDSKLNECSSKSTQTLELDFMEQKVLCTRGIQTVETENNHENIINQTCDCQRKEKGNAVATYEGTKLNITESVIRWAQQIFLHFLWNMYNCPNLEQTVSFVRKPVYKKIPRKESNLSSSLPLRDKKPFVRSSRPRRIHKSRRSL